MNNNTMIGFAEKEYINVNNSPIKSVFVSRCVTDDTRTIIIKFNDENDIMNFIEFYYQMGCVADCQFDNLIFTIVGVSHQDKQHYYKVIGQFDKTLANIEQF